MTSANQPTSSAPETAADASPVATDNEGGAHAAASAAAVQASASTDGDPGGDAPRDDHDSMGDDSVGDTDGLDDAYRALQGGLDKRALEPVLLDVRGQCSYTNYLLLISGRSDRQVDAICEGVLTAMKANGVRPLGVEGKNSGQWALLDFGDVIVHVFHHPLREHYDLEGLWIDAKRVALEVPEQARISADSAY